MSKRTVPYLFLALLGAVLLFIVGVRYGQRVERVNKTIAYLISIPPSPTALPTSGPLQFDEYKHKGCALSFLVPNTVSKTQESSTSAIFADKSHILSIALSCEKKQLIKSDKERSVNLTKSIFAYETQAKQVDSYRFYNSVTGKVVTLTIHKAYLPLIQKSLTVGQ